MNQGKLLDKIPINELFIKSDYNNVINIILISWESPEKHRTSSRRGICPYFPLRTGIQSVCPGAGFRRLLSRYPAPV